VKVCSSDHNHDDDDDDDDGDTGLGSDQAFSQEFTDARMEARRGHCSSICGMSSSPVRSEIRG